MPIVLDYDNEALEIEPGDVDWFRFTMPEAAYVTIDVDAVSLASNLDARLELRDAKGTYLAENNDAGGEDPFLTLWLETGDYHLMIGGVASSSTGEYALSLTATKDPFNDLDEPNDSQDEATAVSQTYTSPWMWIAPGDEDWYEVSVTADVLLNVDVDAASMGSSLDSIVSFYDAAGKLIAESDDSEGFDSKLAAVVRSGRYYVRMRSTSAGQSDFYFLKLTTAKVPADDALEDNDSREKATAVTLNYKKTGLQIVPGDQDWFTFTLASEKTLTVNLDAETINSKLDAYVALYDSSGVEVSTNYTDGVSADPNMVIIVPAGQYFLEVGAQESTRTGGYTLAINGTNPLTADSLETNNSAGQVTKVTLNYASPSLTMLGDEDWFTFTLTKTTKVQAGLTGATTSLFLDLFDAGQFGISAAQTDANGAATFTSELPAGTYYLLVTSTNGGIGSYTLSAKSVL